MTMMRDRYPFYYYLYLYLALLLGIGVWYLVYTNTAMMKKYPTHYYFWLFLAFLLSIFFWVAVLWKFQSSAQAAAPLVGFPTQRAGGVRSLPDHYYQIQPIDRDRIIRDSISHREIISDLVNIAIKDTTYRTEQFVKDFEKKYDPTEYPFSYVDSTLNYVQVRVPEGERMNFKAEVKQRMNGYKLLVWDEALFSMSAGAQDANDVAWRGENLYPLRGVDAQHLTVAVIDNGFDLNHPALKGKSIKPYNATDGSTDVRPVQQNHGTGVASLIMGSRFEDIEGLVPSCRLMPIKVADANELMSNSSVIRGVLYAIKNRADVVNLSLGANLQMLQGAPDSYQQAYIEREGKDEEAFWEELFGYAQQNKTIIVMAAGNDNVMTGFDPFQRSQTTIKVGATTPDGQKAEFSNYGSYTTLYAQGEELKVARPGSQSEVMQGTSFSAPIVSAFMIALKAKYPDYDGDQLLAELLKNTQRKHNLTILHNKTF